MINRRTISDKIAITKTKHTIKTEYFTIYGHKGNNTTAIIPIKIAGNSQALDSAESNLNEANFYFELSYDFYNCFGYLYLGKF